VRILLSNWASLVRTAVLVVGSYLCLVGMLRIAGKRTLSRLDPADFVITTALGSSMASIAIAHDGSLSLGAVTFAAFIFVQWLVNRWQSRSRIARMLVKPTPRLLFFRGEFRRDTMRHESIAEHEILMAIRKHGHAALAQIEAVVLEPDSSLSVIPRARAGSDLGALSNVDGAPEEAREAARGFWPAGVPE
jgi:uncharacterized membrane protein YcaP (DUF421 family)